MKRPCDFTMPAMLQSFVYTDERGALLISGSPQYLSEIGVNFAVADHYISISKKKVLRGFHGYKSFRIGAKMIYCLAGSLFDVCVDIRKDRPSFGSIYTYELASMSKYMLLIPPGFAHCFVATSNNTTVSCFLDTPYIFSDDVCFNYNSVEVDWPYISHILSEKDKNSPGLLNLFPA